MIARSQAVQAGKSPDSAAPAPGQSATPAPATAAPAAAPKTWNKGVLGKGMKGPEVSALQKKLGIPDTGSYDAATIAAVQALQKKLGVAADGAYGPGTKAAHDKMPPAQAATPAPAAPVNVAAPGQPPATAADPSKGTVAGATKAIPTSPVDPTNPSGVGAKAELTPDQAAVRKDILAQPTDAAGNTTDATGTIYKRDLEWMKRFGQGNSAAAPPATGSTPAAATTPAAAPASSQSAQSSAVSADYSSANDAGRNPNAGLEPGDPRWRPQPGEAAAAPQQTATPAPAPAAPAPAAPPGETAGGAATARPVRPATGARAQQIQRQQAGNQMPESRDSQYQKELNAMLRIANLPDRGL
jgi:hypothetical protein